MYVSYFELKKILNNLEKEYSELHKQPRIQTDKKFGLYAYLALKRLDSEVKDFINKKYDE